MKNPNSSHKEKRSNYAPEEGVRYDGIYRIEKCWRKDGQQGYVVCRYLFVRCDNSPAPWTSDEHGDRLRPLPEIPELKGAKDITERKESPHWDFDVTEGCWKWNKHPPPSNKLPTEKGTATSRPKKNLKAKILKDFSCLICNKVLQFPITTPRAHNFCKSCLNDAFEGQKYVRERNTGGRQLRTQKNVMKCPSCPTYIFEFLQNPQVTCGGCQSAHAPTVGRTLHPYLPILYLLCGKRTSITFASSRGRVVYFDWIQSDFILNVDSCPSSTLRQCRYIKSEDELQPTKDELQATRAMLLAT